MRGGAVGSGGAARPPHPAAATFSHGGEKAKEPRLRGRLNPFLRLGFPEIYPRLLHLR
jgi:hypothetical protein